MDFAAGPAYRCPIKSGRRSMDEDKAVTTSKPGIPKSLLWFAGIVVAVIAGWQVLNGAFVKSITAPGGSQVTFYPKHDDPTAAQSLRNSIEQGGGQNNRAAIVGTDNKIVQDGTGNTATIGGLPPGFKDDSDPKDDRDH
jgi:hypothetical protein